MAFLLDESTLSLSFESILPFDLQADLTLLNDLELRKYFLPGAQRAYSAEADGM